MLYNWQTRDREEHVCLFYDSLLSNAMYEKGRCKMG